MQRQIINRLPKSPSLRPCSSTIPKHHPHTQRIAHLQHQRAACFTSSDTSPNSITRKVKRRIPKDGITLQHFLASSLQDGENQTSDTTIDDRVNGSVGDDRDDIGPVPTSAPLDYEPLMEGGSVSPSTEYKFHLKTYGCQMNVSDSDIIRSILLSSTSYGITFIETPHEHDAQLLLTNTCAIRENAESKVWNRLRELRALDRKHPLVMENVTGGSGGSGRMHRRDSGRNNHQRKRRLIGVLGCTAERLKESVFEYGADLVVGPDAYRDLPRLVSALAPPTPTPTPTQSPTTTHTPKRPTPPTAQPVTTTMENHDDSPLERALNVQLSLEETYADITPVRSDPNNVSAFVSVMRGCNNMCSYCVVPFTRGRERSRELSNIVDEARRLYEAEEVKEIVLLGQNVNSYHDKSGMVGSARDEGGYQTSNEGFTNLYRLRGGAGYYFVDLVEAVSSISPELRVRFTSPHPKDYPPALLELMAERYNVCKQLHMPAQSGNTDVLERMRRGYTRDAYLSLIDTVKATIPDVAISSDFISGFCGETDGEHLDTLSLMEYVKYEQAFMFAYSMRGKTHAHRTMVDDVPEEVKRKRLQEVIATFRRCVQERNLEVETGRLRLVLVEGEAKRRDEEGRLCWSGRTDQNKRLVFPVLEEEEGDTMVVGDDGEVFPACWSEETVRPIVTSLRDGITSTSLNEVEDWTKKLVKHESNKVPLRIGDYAVVQVTEVKGSSLRGRLLWRSTMQGFQEMGLDHTDCWARNMFGDGLTEQYQSSRILP